MKNTRRELMGMGMGLALAGSAALAGCGRLL